MIRFGQSGMTSQPEPLQKMSQLYSAHFQRPERAALYDDEFAPGTYSSLMWHIEQQQLQSVIADLRRIRPRISTLDFAAGTGRITAFLEQHVDDLLAVELNPSMAEIARDKLTRAQVLCANLLSTETALTERYDLITAFRFLLNVEPTIREHALRVLTSLLRDENSLLVFNNHGNPISYRGFKLPLYGLRYALRGRPAFGNYLTGSAVERMIRNAGLEILRVMACGIYSPRLLKAVDYDRAVELETKAALRVPRFGVNQMYVCKKAA